MAGQQVSIRIRVRFESAVEDPVIGIMKNEPIPRGDIATPACSEGYPRRVCSMMGRSTRLPKSTNPSTGMRNTPVL